MRECIICYDEFEEFVTLPCNHELCADCHLKVLEISGRCPLCAGRMKEAEKPRVQRREVQVQHPPPQSSLRFDPFCRCLFFLFALSVSGGMMYSISNGH